VDLETIGVVLAILECLLSIEVLALVIIIPGIVFLNINPLEER